jgi:hypothetical protein
VLVEAIDDPSVVDEWRIPLDGARPTARPIDREYAAALE